MFWKSDKRLVSIQKVEKRKVLLTSQQKTTDGIVFGKMGLSRG